MTVAMQLELFLKYYKAALKDFKVFKGLGLHHLTTSTGGWVGGRGAGWLGGRVACLKLEIKLSASNEIEVELS